MRLEAYLAQHHTGPRIELHVKGLDREDGIAEGKRVSNSRIVGSRKEPHARLVYPLSVDKCREMRDVWGKTLLVHRALGDWYRVAERERAAQVAITKQADTDLTVVPKLYPQLNTWLKGDQRVTAAWLAGVYRGGGLLADEVGTGKTAGVIAGLVEAQIKGRVLVVCPKVSVRAVWGKHFAMLTPDVPVYLGRGTRAKRERVLAEFEADTSPLKVLVIVAEMLRVKAIRAKGRVQEFLGYEYPELFNTPWNAVVVDESQKLMGGLTVVGGNLAAEGLRALPTTADRVKVAASATPFGKGGKVYRIFGTLHWLWPDEYSSFWTWVSKYFEVNEDQVFIRGGRGATKTVKRVGKYRDGMSERALWESLGPRVLRRTMEEVSPEHRGLKNWIEVPCEMEPKQARLYRGFADNGEQAVEGGIVSSVGVLDFMTRCRQFANGVLRVEGGAVRYTGESAKLDMLMEMLDRTDRKVVIASQYNEFLDAVEERLLAEGYWTDHTGNAATHPLGSYVRLDGKTSEGKREAYMHAFQSPGGPAIFLLNSQAGGVSITLDAADEMHQLDEMYPPEANTQLYGRIFRRGRVHETFYYLYRTMGTIDEQIGHNVGEGHAAQLRLLDGRRGLEYVRKLATYRP